MDFIGNIYVPRCTWAHFRAVESGATNYRQRSSWYLSLFDDFARWSHTVCRLMLAPIEDTIPGPGMDSPPTQPESPTTQSPGPTSPMVPGGIHSSPMMGRRFSDSSVNRQLTEPLVPGQKSEKIELWAKTHSCKLKYRQSYIILYCLLFRGKGS